ncbi:hypothetical protein OIE67_02995 [Nonomuraea fuscirosea]|uniref:hypothetical protein n=1 Tax=Nonomuraea fuscirosea TaxID=1291556 RepID=UPI002DDA4E6B|nr:hypothetical protein [Nonomuraea fuscirosea]WSA53622.1 hypothetical protein OIE67_02995 [Nonomuraea fuscirosea]
MAAGLGFGLIGTAHASPRTAVSAAPDFSTNNLWYTYATYVPYSACVYVGEDLVRSGEVIDYYCKYSSGTQPYRILYVYVD